MGDKEKEKEVKKEKEKVEETSPITPTNQRKAIDITVLERDSGTPKSCNPIASNAS